MKIAIVVPGRFHAFELTLALEKRGHEVVLFTNYPRWTAKRFGLRPEQFRSFAGHGLAARLCGKLHSLLPKATTEQLLTQAFGAWAARAVSKEHFDVIHAFTGVAEELLLETRRRGESGKVILMRGSSHIRTQWRILEEEVQRTGQELDRPSPWMLAREEREYALADHIAVLSTFAANSFYNEGVAREKVLLLPLGSDLNQFYPAPETVAARLASIQQGNPLRVLFIGTLSFRKGAWDLREIVRTLAPAGFQFTVIADVPPECAALAGEMRAYATLLPRQPQNELPLWHAKHDIFLFPTLEDGYAVVLAQAFAAALCIVASENCASGDLLQQPESGFAFPIRQSQAMIDCLRELAANRSRLAAVVENVYRQRASRSWDDCAAEFAAAAEARRLAPVS